MPNYEVRNQHGQRVGKLVKQGDGAWEALSGGVLLVLIFFFYLVPFVGTYQLGRRGWSEVGGWSKILAFMPVVLIGFIYVTWMPGDEGFTHFSTAYLGFQALLFIIGLLIRMFGGKAVAIGALALILLFAWLDHRDGMW